jgi:hypothetical protein
MGLAPLGGRDPDADGVALAAATATGVVLGPRFATAAAWVAAACCLAVACLAAAGPSRVRDNAGGNPVVGVLVLGALLASGAAAALACRLADPLLIALVAIARRAAGLPGGSITLSGPARAVPAAIVALVLAAARCGAVRHTCLAPPQCRTTSRGRARGKEMTTADELRRVVLSLPEAEERETWGHPDLPGPGQDARRPHR